MKKETAKRIFLCSILLLMALSIFAGFARAITLEEAAEDAEGAIDDFGRITNNYLFAPIFGNEEQLSIIFFSVLLGLFVYSVINRIKIFEENWIKWTISIIVTLLSLRGLPIDFLLSIRLHYGAMGAALLTLIPFVMMFMITLDSRITLLFARVAWIFYVVYYFALYIYALVDKGFDKLITGQSLPYLAGIIAGILIIWWIKELRAFVIKGETEGLAEQAKRTVGMRKIAKAYDEAMAEIAGGS